MEIIHEVDLIRSGWTVSNSSNGSVLEFEVGIGFQYF